MAVFYGLWTWLTHNLFDVKVIYLPSGESQLHNTHFLSSIVRVLKSRRMRWQDMRHTWGRCEIYAEFYLESLKERDELQDLDIYGRIILR